MVVCRGAPRDLGLDQGLALRAAIRRRAARRGLRARLAARLGSDTAALQREIDRHFPHLGERLRGMSRAAGVPRRALVGLLGEALRAERSPRAAGAATPPGGALLARTVDAGAEAAPVVVRSDSDHGFVTLSLRLPWCVHAFAGVNEAGLAGAFVPVVAAASPDPRGAAPPALLLEDCLLRLHGAEEAVEWCLRRPAAGSAALLFADARAGVAGALVAGAQRRVLRPEAGLLAAGSDAAELEKTLRAHPPEDAEDLAAAFPRPHGLLALADPTQRRLGIRAPGADPRWCGL